MQWLVPPKWLTSIGFGKMISDTLRFWQMMPLHNTVPEPGGCLMVAGKQLNTAEKRNDLRPRSSEFTTQFPDSLASSSSTVWNYRNCRQFGEVPLFDHPAAVGDSKMLHLAFWSSIGHDWPKVFEVACGKDMNAECPWFEMILCHKQEHQVKRLCEDTLDLAKKSCVKPCAKFLQLGSLVVGRQQFKR